VAARPDVLLAGSGYISALALKKATTTIPIVFNVGEPVAAGLVTSLARPGGNLTGGTIPAELELKRVQILIEVLGPSASVVHLTTPLSEARKASFLAALAATRMAPGARLQFLEVSKSEDLAPAFEQMTRQRVSGVAVRLTPLTGTHSEEIAALAVKHRLPAIGDGTDYADLGFLMSYSIDWSEVTRQMAKYVYKILKGAQPADLPIEQVTKFEFVVNMKTARALGVRVPLSVLTRATRVID
jgi:putative ABC transport system substrate-binding protein